ncbi:MAG: transporter related [Chloroflexi bacterium]|nr:transporter related [Chloroflexota bacterium]
MAMIEAHQLSRRFGKLTAVDNLNLEVGKGEVLGFLGPNGAGKTTTIRLLAGIIAATSGYGLVAGWRTDGPVEPLHEAIGLLTESPGFYNRLSASRNLEYFGGFYQGLNIPAQAEKYLKIMGLLERRADRVGTYSKGMKGRLALARALLHEPRVLFLDEPTAGLDPEASEEVRGLIKKLSTEGRTIFLSTHNLAEAEQLCHRIAIFRTRLLALDTPQNLRERLFRRRVVIRLESVDDATVKAIEKLHFVKSCNRDGPRLNIELGEAEKELPELVRTIVQAGGRVLEVTEEHHSLEEIYLNLVREDVRV